MKLSSISIAISGFVNSARAPTLGLQFAGATALDSRVTFTRASTATYVGSAGLLKTAAVNEARLVYDPATLSAQGLLVEEQRTNAIRNNMMVGAVAGTPGTLPTNWSYYLTQSNGLTASIVGTGVESGISYIDLRFAGTTVNTNPVALGIDSGTAATGQTWASSVYWKIVSGSTADMTNWTIGLIENTSGGSFVAGAFYNQTAPTTASISTQRPSATRTLSGGATVALVQMVMQFTPKTGVAIDITLRIGMPQLELGAFATSVIPTTTAQATRAADVATMTGTNFSSWYNQTEGTFVAEYQASPNTFTSYLVASNGVTAQNSFHFDNDSGNMRAVYYSGSAAVATLSLGSTGTVGASTKVASAYSVNNFTAARNAGAVVTDTSGAVPVSLTQLNIGADPSGAAVNVMNSAIKSITYYPRRLSDTELQALTS